MVHFFARFRAEAEERLQTALERTAPGTEARFAYGEPPAGQGEYAAGCFPLAGALKKSPAAIAEALALDIEEQVAEAEETWISAVLAVGPYVNFHIDVGRLMVALLDETHTDAAGFGTLDERDQTVILEHTSANPNGPLHVGRARNPIIGDTLVRLYRAAGYDVTSQYYVDDMGKQVAILAWGLENLTEEQVSELIGLAQRDKVDHRLVRYYQAANQLMEGDPQVKEQIQAFIRATEEGEEGALERAEAGYRDVFTGMLQTLERLDVGFDEFVKESAFVVEGDTERVIDALASQDQIPVGKEGEALYLDLSGEGVTGRSTKFFFRRSDGTSLYATRDVAYHLWKAQRADRLVNVLGEDHKLQAKQVRTCLEVLGADPIPEVIFYSFVSLPEGKMSTRRGRVVFIDDLLDEAVSRAYEEVKKRRGDELSEEEMQEIAELVGVGAIRFAIVKVQCEKQITFKWEEALSFDGFAAPFVQYSHARIAGILDKAKGMGLVPIVTGAEDLLIHESEVNLAKTIARLPQIVEEAAEKHKPHMLPTYAYDVADAFNAFYRDCRVVDAEGEELRAARLALVEAARVALANALRLMGIAAPRQM